MGGRSIRVTHNAELLNRPGFAQPRGGGVPLKGSIRDPQKESIRVPERGRL